MTFSGFCVDLSSANAIASASSSSTCLTHFKSGSYAEFGGLGLDDAGLSSAGIGDVGVVGKAEAVAVSSASRERGLSRLSERRDSKINRSILLCICFL